MKPETREAIHKMKENGAKDEDIAAATHLLPSTVRAVLAKNGHATEPAEPLTVKAMQRAKILELAADGMDKKEIAKVVGVNTKRVANVVYAEARSNGKKPRRQPRRGGARSVGVAVKVHADVAITTRINGADELDRMRGILLAIDELSPEGRAFVRSRLLGVPGA